jgi:predicted phage terminase large subunit-like protein
MPTKTPPSELVLDLSPAKRAALTAALQRHKARQAQAAAQRLANREWLTMARPKQLPPHNPRHHLPDENGNVCGCDGVDTDYEVWMMCAGRGLGKTMAGASNLVIDALAGCTVNPGGHCRQCPHTWGVIGPTREAVQEICFQGVSGILAALEPEEIASYNKSLLMVTLTNGNQIRGFSAQIGDRQRGLNLSGVWVDELANFQYEDVWHQMRFALRIGKNPRIYVTTTPYSTRLMRQLFKDAAETGKVHITTGHTFENKANLGASALEALEKRYGGTRMGRQELAGELLEDVEGALWWRALFDDHRVKAPPRTLKRCVVAVDPAMTSGENSDETGIIVAGVGDDDEAYVLADLSGRFSPGEGMERVVRAFNDFEADCIVAEQNNGGDFVRDLVHTVDPNVPYRQVYASRGKATRAQPVSALYEQGRVHHVGTFAELEDQCCMWMQDDLNSPDRMDALVWAIIWLRDLYAGSITGAYGYGHCPHCESFIRMEGMSSCDKCGSPLRLSTTNGKNPALV